VKPAVIRGDALHLPLPDACVDAICTDPPYGLEFMGRDWDSFKTTGRDDLRHTARMNQAPEHVKGNPWSSERKSYGAVKKNPRCKRCGRLQWAVKPCQCEHPDWDLRIAESMRVFGAWCGQVGAELLRVAKPGAHLAAFGGTRTWHRLVVGLEDAGWEIRDTLMWLYGSGFPKSLDVSKAIDRAAGAEREVIGHQARQGRSAGIMGKHTELVRDPTVPATAEAAQWDGWGTALKPAWEPIVLARKPLTGTVAANVTAHGVGALNIDACRIGTEDDTSRTRAVVGDTAAPFGRGYAMGGNGSPAGRWPANLLLDTDTAQLLDRHAGNLTGGTFPGRQNVEPGTGRTMNGGWSGDIAPARRMDSGGPSRFYYTAKAGRADRGTGNNHPTVKPVDLMRWLIRLVTPRDALILDPFAGSGTTGQAAEVEGRRCVLVERDPGYCELVQARIDRPAHLTLDLT
jgi:site-specific DNA-methyltransferase (adenine-specific)